MKKPWSNMKSFAPGVIAAVLSFFVALVLGQLIAPKAMAREDVEKLIREDRDKPPVQVELRNINERLIRIERMIDERLPAPIKR